MSISFRIIGVCCLFILMAQAQQCAFVTQRVQCNQLTCNRTSHTCVPCTNNSQCYERSMGCKHQKCVLLPLEEAFDAFTVVAPVTAFLICAVAVVAGIGGGGILVPLYFATLDLPLLNAVALSQATIAGQSFFNVCLLLSRRHPRYSAPNPTRPVINYEYLCLMLPISLVGTMLGNLLSQISPNWLRIVMLYTLLSYILYRIIKKLIKQRKDDMEKRALLKKQETEVKEPESPHGSINDFMPEPEVEQLLPQYPWRWFLFIVLTFGLLFGTDVLRGPRANLIQCGTGAFWGSVAGVTVYNFLLAACVYYVLSKRRQRVLAGELSPEVIPFKWSVKTTIVFPIVSLSAGAAASMLGIGGGLVLSFLLYEVGMVPEEASATSGVATFLVATCSASQFVLQHQLRADYGFMLFGAGVCSTFVGQFVFNRQIKKHNWTFLILGSLAFVIIGSMAALTAVGIYNTYETVHHGGSLGFGQLCKPSPHISHMSGGSS